MSSANEIEETLSMVEEDDDMIKSAKAKMDEVAEENKKLKLTLSQIMKDYQSLKTNFEHMIIKQEDHLPKKDSSPVSGQEHDESEVVCRLSLGRLSGDHQDKKEEKKNNQENKHKLELARDDHEGLELGLDSKFQSTDSPDHRVTKNSNTLQSNGLDESKEGESDVVDTSLKGSKRGRNGEGLEQNPFKKPRVSVRAVCDTQTMNDGGQWRKYGQKIAKGNPCPRAYYRCTASSSCPVRKQVQRCAENMAILTTTYEGTHNHPLPPSATSMAAATTSAAAMLSSGSTSSSASPPPHDQGVLSAPSFFNRFHFTSSNIFPRASISTSQSHPTVVLDLTTPHHNSIASYNKFHPSTSYSSPARPNPAPLFTFPAPPSSISTGSHSLGMSSHMLLHRKNLAPPSLPQPYNNIFCGNSAQEDQITSDGIGAAAKAITSDPAFQTALATAITSLLGNGGVIGFNQEPNSGENVNLTFSQPSARNAATGYSNKFLRSLN